MKNKIDILADQLDMGLAGASKTATGTNSVRFMEL